MQPNAAATVKLQSEMMDLPAGRRGTCFLIRLGHVRRVGPSKLPGADLFRCRGQRSSPGRNGRGARNWRSSRRLIRRQGKDEDEFLSTHKARLLSFGRSSDSTFRSWRRARAKADMTVPMGCAVTAAISL